MKRIQKLITLLIFLSSNSMISPIKDYIATLDKYENRGKELEKQEWWKMPFALEQYFKGLVASKDFMAFRFARALGLSNEEIEQRYPFDGKRYKNIKAIKKLSAFYKSFDHTLIVESEKGLGDIIQFARYVPYLKVHFKHVIFEVPKSLYSLFKASSHFEGVTIATPGMIQYNAEKLESALKLPLFAAPLIIIGQFTYIPHLLKSDKCPYLFAPSAEKEKIQSDDRFKTDKLKVGIHWQGAKNHINDKNRSVPLSTFIPLTTLPHVQLYSVQIGEGLEQLSQHEETKDIIDLQDSLNGFSQTAAVFEKLDLIITIDSAVAHLAGALGKNVWMLVPSIPDFRWFLSGNTTEWYPSMKLFRQSEPGNWESVISEITNELSQIKFT